MEMNYKIDELLALSNEEMYIHVSKELFPDETNIFPIKDSQHIAKGKLWVEKNYKKMMKELCEDESIKNLFSEKDTMKKVEFTSALIDLLGGFYFGVSPALLSVIIISHGYFKICESNDD